jgi:hypothetical protein
MIGVSCVIAALTACASAGPSRAGSARVDPYDVAAANACHELDVFVRDAKSGQASRADSTALDDARNKLNARWNGRLKWMSLSEDLSGFVNAAAGGDASTAVQFGKQAGEQCIKVPAPAARAGGLTN